MTCKRCADTGILRRACELVWLADELCCRCEAGEKLRGVIAGVVKAYVDSQRSVSVSRTALSKLPGAKVRHLPRGRLGMPR